jgi:N-acetyl-1-D-myo-inositol-2-amino-2-deoxy-alpha-D-glucopyranoside deacetylase
MTGASLLAVFAHPDDESLACGGLLACCAELGARVSLLCLTRGERGPGAGVHGARLGEMRARELTEAARLLGVSDVLLRGHQDGMLPWTDAELLEADVLDAVRRFDPDVVVTFDEDGLYWHPDHVAVHERVTAVVAGLGAAGPALLYVGMPSGAMRAVVDAAARDRRCGGALRPPLGVDDPDAFGSMAPHPTLVLEAALAHAERKVAALRRHRSQIEGTALDCLDALEAARLLSTEHYRRARVGAVGETFLERLATVAPAPARA